MKHVFVETNFLVELVRPFPARAAEQLVARNGADVTLYVPWVSVVEAKRTLDRVINEDLGFGDAMMKYAVREYLAGRCTAAQKSVLEGFARQVKRDRAAALQARHDLVDARVASMLCIEPTAAVVRRTLSMFPIKSLPPFDEMVMGAVLSKADELNVLGETALYFCNLNRSDFDPTNRPTLDAEYRRLNLTYLDHFNVP